MSNLELVKKLRQETGLGIVEIKSALERAAGNLEKAKDLLRAEGKKASSNTVVVGEGVIGHYIHHNGQLGALVELNCQTDFTARNPEFRELANKLAMHVTSANPKYLSRDEVPSDQVEKEKQFCIEQAKAAGRPAKIIEDKILPGQMNNFFAQICLLDQGFIADEATKIGDMVAQLAKKVGETVVVKRFSRFQVGVQNG